MTKKEKSFAVIIGCATFAVFALILEGTCNALILSGGRAAALMQKPVLFGLFGGLMAGLFEETGRFEWTATVKNINADYNLTLQNNCQALNDYVKYIDRIKSNLKNNIKKDIAIEEALDWAIANNFLEGFFREQRAKVLAVSITEFDQDLYDRCRRREGFEEGLETGRIQAAGNLLRLKTLSTEQIAQALDLPLEKVLELQKTITVNV